MIVEIVEPTFVNEINRIEFTSRLWGTTITAQDVSEWGTYLLLRPTMKLEFETHHEFYMRERAWVDGCLARPAFFALVKWYSYRLGKIQSAVEAYLTGKKTLNRTQALEAVSLQLSGKFAAQIVGKNVTTELLSLIQSIVWTP